MSGEDARCGAHASRRNHTVAGVVFVTTFAVFLASPVRPPASSCSHQIETIGGHQYYYFPLGSSVLLVPFVAAMRAVGVSTIAGDGHLRLPRRAPDAGGARPLPHVLGSAVSLRSRHPNVAVDGIGGGRETICILSADSGLPPRAGRL